MLANPHPLVDTLPLAGRDQGWGSSQPPNGDKQTYPRPLHPPAYSSHSPTIPAGSREPACGRQMGEGGVRLPLGPWALCRPKLKRLAAPEFQKTHRMRRGGVSNISKLMRPVSPHATQSRPPAGLARRRFRTPIFPAITAPPHCPASDKLVDRSGCDQIGSFPLRIGPTTS